MSAPEPQAQKRSAPGVTLAACTADIVEVVALRGRAANLERVAAARGVRLPAPGRLAFTGDQLALCVRPERWLLLSTASAAGATAAAWQRACEGCGAAVDHSSGLTALELAGPQGRAVLARGWRLDLDPRIFPAGHAAASIMAQVAVIVAALPTSLLLLTPATTSRHLREWLGASSRFCGLAMRADVPLQLLSGEVAT